MKTIRVKPAVVGNSECAGVQQVVEVEGEILGCVEADQGGGGLCWGRGTFP